MCHPPEQARANVGPPGPDQDLEASGLQDNKDRGQIISEVGCEEKAYFTRGFKKNTGQMPTEFREDMRKLVG